MSKRRRRGDRQPNASSSVKKAPKVKDVFVARPFQGLVDEAEWVALRELVPAATVPVRLSDELSGEHGERDVTLATVLPLAWPAVVKPDGRILLGLQRTTHSGDVSRDIALALLNALRTEPGQPVDVPPLPGPGPRLQDVLAAEPLEVTVRDNFDFWLDEQPAGGAVKASLERANASAFPTVRMSATPAAYWCRFPDKAHVRWVLPDDEDRALVALARLSASGRLGLGDQTRFAGMFRAHGLLVPVWDLPEGAEAKDWEEPLAEVAARYAEVAAAGADLDPAGLDPAERRARQGLLSRQITIR